MGGNMKDKWSVPVTAVANEFIDTYMAAANGEYVKVYLYVLRHQGKEITIELIADALNHTESDVRRALSYWEKAGVLTAPEREQPVLAARNSRFSLRLQIPFTGVTLPASWLMTYMHRCP